MSWLYDFGFAANGGKVIGKVGALIVGVALGVSGCAMGQSADRSWIAVSNGYAKELIDVVFAHHPEAGSQQGLSQFDGKVSQPTLADEEQERRENEAVLAKLKQAAAQKQQKEVAEDLQIMIRKATLDIKREDFRRANEVPFLNASEIVFSGVRVLLDEQTPAERRQAAVTRIREYAGLEQGYKPLTEILKGRVTEQMAKPGVVYPAKVEIETEMARDGNYLEGMEALFKKYDLQGWQEPFAKLKAQLTEYDGWVRATVLPKARDRFPPAAGALCAGHGELRHRYSAGAAGGDGAQGVCGDPGGDEADRGGDREGAAPAVERLSRRDPGTEEAATGGGRDPAVL